MLKAFRVEPSFKPNQRLNLDLGDLNQNQTIRHDVRGLYAGFSFHLRGVYVPATHT